MKWFASLLGLLLLIPPTFAEAQVSITIDPSVEGHTRTHNLLGTNLPTWINRFHVTDPGFIARADQSGTTLVRIPGGSWSNSFQWAPCERDDVCSFGNNEGWVIRPTDYINFLKATGRQGMYTLNHNGTAKEAAALVAFFNGSVDDHRSLGEDVRGHDWGMISDWAKLRRDHGNPEPFTITWWEFGNEVYGGKQGQGKDCLSYGWEETWTCDGTEYVTGIGSGAQRHEGYLEFQAAMKMVDPSIQLGAVGVSKQEEWTNWGNEVIAAAGDRLDFYIVHQYAYYNPPATRQTALSEPQSTWESLVSGIDTAFDFYAAGRRVPYAVTEYNMFSSWDRDPDTWMLQAVNMLHLADTIGQMATHGISIANQWAMANGAGSNGSDYGLFHPDTFIPYSTYYVFPLWEKFGTTLIPVQSEVNAETTLSLYSARIDNTTLSLMAINKTGSPIDSTISVNGHRIQSALADQAGADSLNATTIAYNGITDPAVDFANAPPTSLPVTAGGLVNHTFPKYSVSMLQLTVEDTRGDMNGDKTIDLYDLILVLQALTDQAMGQITIDGDTNDNNRIGLEEAIFLLRKLGGLTTTSP